MAQSLFKPLAFAVAALTLAGGAQAETAAPMTAPMTAPMIAPMTAKMAGPDGQAFGTVTLTPAAAGGAILKLALTGLPKGTLAIHLHETGACTAPDFKSAGGHISGGHQHGMLNPEGAHAGDLPNLEVGDDGVINAEIFATAITAQELTDADGAAVVIHAGPDDYTSQPAGASGDRIVCGVLTAS